MAGQALLLLSDHASYMTGGEYFVDGSVKCLIYCSWKYRNHSVLQRKPCLVMTKSLSRQAFGNRPVPWFTKTSISIRSNYSGQKWNINMRLYMYVVYKLYDSFSFEITILALYYPKIPISPWSTWCSRISKRRAKLVNDKPLRLFVVRLMCNVLQLNPFHFGNFVEKWEYAHFLN